MVARFLLYFTLIIKTVINTTNKDSNQYIPFFVMQPHTVINQTLHSYCKEQSEFNTYPMFINLTEWPSGFIYARNPYQRMDSVDDTALLSIQECTMELRTTIGNRIRFVFYPITNNREDYDPDYAMSMSKSPCLRIRDNQETITFDCPILFDRNKSLSLISQSDDYLSNSNLIYLELLPPFQYPNDYDDSYYQFKLFFTTFIPKLYVGKNNEIHICPIEQEQIDCDDSYCVPSNARCNGVNDCRTKIDEDSCLEEKSSGKMLSPLSTFPDRIRYILTFIFLFKL